MVDAVYEVLFTGEPSANSVEIVNFSAGILVLEKNAIRGGDSTFYYLGQYQYENSIVNATISVFHYSPDKPNTIGSSRQYDFVLSGRVYDDKLVLTGRGSEGVGEVTLGLQKIRSLKPCDNAVG